MIKSPDDHVRGLLQSAIEHMEANAMLRRFAVVPVMLALAACDWSFCNDCMQVGDGGPPIVGSGTLTTETRQVGKFTAIQMSGIVGALSVERTGTESLDVTAEDNLISFFTSEVKDGVLILSVAKGKTLKGKRPDYKATVGDLRAIDVSGSGKIEATKLDGDALTISISGAASGDVAGRADDLTISISGVASLDASELKAKRAKIVVSGTGSVTVNASDALDAQVSGVGKVTYIGSPKLTSSVSGLGSVSKK
jgi:Putative auto-transporter adhesin, head GIN domain